MKLSLSINRDAIPVVVFLLLLVKLFHVGYGLVSQEGVPMDVLLTNLCYLADNLAWMPMAVFFMYFYMYRVGRVSNVGLRNASLCALLSSLPKLGIIVLLVRTYMSQNMWMMVYYVFDIVAWIMLCLYVISYWRHDFKLKEKHTYRPRKHKHH